MAQNYPARDHASHGARISRSRPTAAPAAEPLEQRRLLSNVVNFLPLITTPTGSAPAAVAVGDFNGDGKLDLAVVNNRDSTVSILLGNGDGTFSPTPPVTVGNRPLGLVVGDFNGDGKPDIAVVNGNDNTVTVLLGNGDGSFLAKAPIPVGASPNSAVAADLNGDGKLDLVVTDVGDNTVDILLGKGNGRFTPGSVITIPKSAGAVAGAASVADVNGDGKPDLVLGLGAGRGNSAVGTLLGNGDGTFQAAKVFLAGGYGLDAVAVADFNGDGKPDVTFENIAGSQYGPAASGPGLLLGNGDGSLGPAPRGGVGLATGYLPGDVIAGDFNGDGFPDLIVANTNGVTRPGAQPSAVSVLLGNGDGTFNNRFDFAAGSSPSAEAFGDFNGDGKPDIVVVQAGANTVGVLLNASRFPSITRANGTVVAKTGPGDTVTRITSDGTRVKVRIDGIKRSFPISTVNDVALKLGGGNDSVRAGAGVPPTTVAAGGGNDTIVAHNNLDLLGGGKGNNLIYANGFEDTAMGGRGNDTLAAGKGAGNMLVGGSGGTLFVNTAGSGDMIVGGPGLSFAAANSNDTLTNVFEIYNPAPPAPKAGVAAPGAGTTSPAATATPAAPFTFLPELVRGNVPPAPPSGVVPFVSSVTAAIVGNKLKVTGSPGDDSISVASDGAGNLLVTAGGGAPQTFPEAGLAGVLLVGGAGNDTLAVDASVLLPATLRGGAGNDSLAGGGGDNVLVGGAGNDTLVGGGRANLLVPGPRLTFGGMTGSDRLVGGPAGSSNTADFSHRTDNLVLSNDGRPDSGDAAAGETTTIMPSVQNIFAGTGDDTVTSTTPNSFLTSGVGHDSITSGGAASVLVAGPNGGDTLASAGAHDALFLRNGQADAYKGDVTSDILQLDAGIDTLAT